MGELGLNLGRSQELIHSSKTSLMPTLRCIAFPPNVRTLYLVVATKASWVLNCTWLGHEGDCSWKRKFVLYVLQARTRENALKCTLNADPF